jgi:hypothetical protein
METQLQNMSDQNKILTKTTEKSRIECANLRETITILIEQISALTNASNVVLHNTLGIAEEINEDENYKWTKVIRKKRRRAMSGKSCILTPEAPAETTPWSISPVQSGSIPKHELNPLSKSFTPADSLKSRLTIRAESSLPKRRRTLPSIPQPESLPPQTNHLHQKSAEGEVRRNRIPASASSIRQDEVSRNPGHGTENNDTPVLPASRTMPATPETDCKPRIAVIGSSMIRNTGQYISNKLKSDYIESCVYSTSGYSLDRAIVEVPDMINDFRKSDTVVLYLGTADICNDSVENVVSKYCILIDKCKCIAPESSIFVSAVPYRLHSYQKNYNTFIDKLNRCLRMLCSNNSQCTFIDVNPAAVEENYHSDGLHFSYRGRRVFQEFLVSKLAVERNFHVFVNQQKI